MKIHKSLNTLEKLDLMGDSTLFEPAGDQPTHEGRTHRMSNTLPCVSNVSTPTGAKPIMKTMMTTACERDCYYCPFRAGRGKTQRVTIKPDEMASTFDQLQSNGMVQGLFLSSGIIKGSVTTQDKILDTVEIIRRKYQYNGYVHLKIMPGAEYHQVYRAMQLADRISVNLEAPTQERLDALAPKKNFEHELLNMLRLSAKIRRDHPEEKLARTVTQFVVGAVGDTDLELLTLTSGLHRNLGLTRAYFSAFHPILQTPLENVAPTDSIREFRLYQSSFLLRDYGWEVEDLPFSDSGNLPTTVDPKMAWADAHLRDNPVDLRTAERAVLLRIPGIGLKSADAIMKARTLGKITELSHLRKIGIAAPERTAPYILIDGKRPPVQERLF